jgi:hypothetical protein
MTQTYSREDASELSHELVQHLKQGIHETHRQDEWAQRNFELLTESLTPEVVGEINDG